MTGITIRAVDKTDISTIAESFNAVHAILEITTEIVSDATLCQNIAEFAGVGLDFLTRSPNRYIDCSHVSIVLVIIPNVLKEFLACEPVSYTHLDVYKRQG